MNQEKQRIAIAEARGWTSVRMVHGAAMGRPPTLSDTFTTTPDYLNDLNAMHGAEKALSGMAITEYINALDRITRPRGKNYAFATSDQRAEAFLKTLNLWEEDSISNVRDDLPGTAGTPSAAKPSTQSDSGGGLGRSLR